MKNLQMFQCLSCEDHKFKMLQKIKNYKIKVSHFPTCYIEKINNKSLAFLKVSNCTKNVQSQVNP